MRRLILPFQILSSAFKVSILLFSWMVLLACDKPATIEGQQLQSCIDDIQLGLNDPNSLEVLSTRPIDLEGGGYRLALEFTAKNRAGGRVRQTALCGFESNSHVDLDPEDIHNRMRTLQRGLREMGIR